MHRCPFYGCLYPTTSLESALARPRLPTFNSKRHSTTSRTQQYSLKDILFELHQHALGRGIQPSQIYIATALQSLAINVSCRLSCTSAANQGDYLDLKEAQECVRVAKSEAGQRNPQLREHLMKRDGVLRARLQRKAAQGTHALCHSRSSGCHSLLWHTGRSHGAHNVRRQPFPAALDAPFLPTRAC